MTERKHNPHPRSAQIDIEQRIYRVYKLICKGTSRGDIVTFGAKEWGLAPRMIDKYIGRAKELLAEDFADDREMFALQVLGELRDLKARAMLDRQYAVALGCLSRIASITQIDKQRLQ
jgi:hypothetical protein